MNKIEYLLNKLGQEANEVNQRCSKAMEFGLNEVQPGQLLTNRERIEYELHDFIGTLQMCVDHKIVRYPDDPKRHRAKQLKVRQFAEYSRSLGCLSESLNDPICTCGIAPGNISCGGCYKIFCRSCMDQHPVGCKG